MAGVSELPEYAFNLDLGAISAVLPSQAVLVEGGTKLRLEFDPLRSELAVQTPRTI